MLSETGMSTTPLGILEQQRSASLAAMLACVFDRDPHFNWLVRQDGRRQEALEHLFQLLLEDLPGTEGEVHVAADGKAVAIWYPPGGGRLPLRRQLSLLQTFLPICGWGRLPTRALGLQRMETHRPSRPHYFLQVIGVDETVRGLGHGRALMEPVLRCCDACGLPAYLETANPSNLTFYQRQGFCVIGSYGLGRGVNLWRLLRDPMPVAWASTTMEVE